MPSPVVETVAAKLPPTAPVKGAGMLEMDGVLAGALADHDGGNWVTPSAPV